MPDVGLFSATEPLSPKYSVIIKYCVEVEGLPVYQETYDVKTLEQELAADPGRLAEIWFRRVLAPIRCRTRRGFSACLTRCLSDGVCADCGHEHPLPSSSPAVEPAAASN